MHVLTAYAAQSLAVLRELLPDLAQVAVEQEDYFLIEVLAPAGWPFWISSAEEELTVGFAEHHTHFGWHEGDPRQDAAEAAAYIQQLRRGELELAAWYEGDEYVGSAMREVGQEPAPPTWVQRWRRRKQRLALRRWAN